MNDWVNRYVGIPYRPNGRDLDGCDCWGLITLVFMEQRGIVVPDWRLPSGRDSLLEVVRAITAGVTSAGNGGFAERIGQPETWSIVVAERRTRPHHAGLCLGGHVLHASRAGVVCPPASQFNMAFGERSYWRWRPT